jgi:hypothetical protein
MKASMPLRSMRLSRTPGYGAAYVRLAGGTLAGRQARWSSSASFDHLGPVVGQGLAARAADGSAMRTEYDLNSRVLRHPVNVQSQKSFAWPWCLRVAFCNAGCDIQLPNGAVSQTATESFSRVWQPQATGSLRRQRIPRFPGIGIARCRRPCQFDQGDDAPAGAVDLANDQALLLDIGQQTPRTA